MKPRVLIEGLLLPVPGVPEQKRIELLDQACLQASGERSLAAPAAPAAPDQTSRLTPRQRQVLTHLAHGKLIKEIAAAMCLSESTVENYRTVIYRVLGVHNKVEAARIAFRLHVVD
jgi:DNA-binding NarL/FixJ family response regulator